MSIAAVRPGALLATRRARTIAYGLTVAAGALAGGFLTTAAPIGSDGADFFWSAALVAVVATFGATARRWAWFVPAGVGAALAGDGLAMGLAAVAIVISFVSVLRDTRSRARGALVSALGTIALLRAGPLGFHGLTAIVTAAAVAPVIVSGYVRAGRRVKARTRRVAAIAGALTGLALIGAVIGVFGVQRSLADGVRAIDGGMAAARDADDDLAAEQLDLAARSLKTADSTLSSWFVAPARSLPVIGPNIDAVGSLSRQASEVAEVTSLAANEADVDALRFVDGRLDPQAVADMEGPLTSVNRALGALNDEVVETRSPWLISMVTGRIDELGSRVDEAIPEADDALTAVGIAPSLLGADGPQRYLVLFTTPVEARGRAGFPGNYAELVVDDGRMSLPVFGRIADLEATGADSGRTVTQPAEMVARYGRFDIANTWRNLTMTPDFASVTLAAQELYPQSGGGPIDGVISLDPTALASLMHFTGPVTVPGLATELNEDNAAQYLMSDQYIQFADDNEARLDVLDELSRTTFERFIGADLPGPGAVADRLDPMLDGGHIQVAMTDPNTFLQVHDLLHETGFLEAPEAGTDTVLVTTNNAGGSKIDLFLERSERYDVRWDPDTGRVESTLTVTLRNTAPTEGWPDYVIGNAIGLPVGTNRSYVSMYSPLALDAARLDGQPVNLQAETELGRNVYSDFVDIPPGGTVEYQLDLSGTVEGRRYELALPVQPFATTDTAEVTVTPAGDVPLVSRQATVEGGVARWSGTLDRSRTVAVTATRG